MGISLMEFFPCLLTLAYYKIYCPKRLCQLFFSVFKHSIRTSFYIIYYMTFPTTTSNYNSVIDSRIFTFYLNSYYRIINHMIKTRLHIFQSDAMIITSERMITAKSKKQYTFIKSSGNKAMAK
jgi:hypothetical protein